MVVAASFIAVAARMSLVQFLGIYFVHRAGIDVTTEGLAFLCESAARGLAAPLFGALSDRLGRRPLLIASSLVTAVVLPAFLLVHGPVALLAWSLALGIAGAVNIPVSSALLLDLAPPERRQSVLALNYTTMSIAYTLGVVPAGYIAEHGYGILAAASAAGYVLVAALYLAALRAPLPLEKAASAPRMLGDTAAAFGDRRFALFAAIAFVFPLSMGMLVTVTPLYGTARGLGESFIGLVLGANSILVAALALPVATRIEAQGPAPRRRGRHHRRGARLLRADSRRRRSAARRHRDLQLRRSGVQLCRTGGRCAPCTGGAPGRHQGAWTLVSSLSLGSALALSGAISKSFGWPSAWLACAALTLAAAAALHLLRPRFASAT